MTEVCNRFNGVCDNINIAIPFGIFFDSKYFKNGYNA